MHPTVLKIAINVALAMLMTPLLMWWVESLKKWSVQFPIAWVQEFIAKYLIGGWKTKLTTLASGIGLGAGLKLVCVLGLASLIEGLQPFVDLSWATYLVTGAYVGLQNMGLFSGLRSASGARNIA